MSDKLQFVAEAFDKLKLVGHQTGRASDTALPLPHDRQFHKARFIRRVINALRRFFEIRRLGPKDIRHECLRIAIVEREPA